MFDCIRLTSGKDFPTDLVALDPQLAEYAWQTRIPDVAFLWFVKAGHGFKKGSRITLLQANQALWAGWEGLVIDITEPFGPATEDGKFTAQEEDKPVGLYIGDYAALTKYEAAIKGLRGKARDAAEKKALDEGLGDGTIIAANDTHVTKQRLQFAAARLSEQEMDDVGRSVAQSTSKWCVRTKRISIRKCRVYAFRTSDVVSARCGGSACIGRKSATRT